MASWRSQLACVAPCLAACAPVPRGIETTGGAPAAAVTITAQVTSTRFVTREHMLAAGEMQISGEPLAEAMGRDLSHYSRDLLTPDIYNDADNGVFWVDLPGFSTAIESYEYSKQPMNNLAFEAGAGPSLVYGPLVDTDGASGPAATAHLATLIQHFAVGSNARDRWVFAAGTFPPNNPLGDVNPTGAGAAADNPLGWPGIWPTSHVFRSFDPSIDPTSEIALRCSIASDDAPDEIGAVTITGDYECNATTLRLRDRIAQSDAVITPGADGFSGWKYGLWVLNYLQIMHDSTNAAVAAVADGELAAVGVAGNGVTGTDADGLATAPGTFLGSSDIEGFQAQAFILAMDNRAEDWLTHFATSDGATLSGFPSVAAALAYDYAAPLRWFPGAIAVTETDDGSGFPRPAYALAGSGSDLLDLLGLAMGYAEVYTLTDIDNVDVGGSQPARAFFDGDPFAADDQDADGEATLHDRALAMMRVAMVDLDRLHADPVSGLFADTVAMTGATPVRGHTVSTTSVAYAVIGLRTVLRAVSSQLELYSNNTPDTAIGRTSIDALPIHFPSDPALAFTGRVTQLARAQANLLLEHLTDASGRAWSGWDLSASAHLDETDVLDAHTAAIRGLFAAFLASGDVRYRDRAIAVFDRMEAVFYDADARIYSVSPAPVASVEFTPLRFALLQSALRDMYELVAARPGGEAREPILESRLGRLNKLVLNGWDDRNGNRFVDWPGECATASGGVPHGGLQMAERALTGELGRFKNALGQPTLDREHDCVPEVDDAHLPAALADSITFEIARP